VVFEKFAEMNNKYDVKNFSDIIDQFKVEDEVETISKSIVSEISEKSKSSEILNDALDPIITPDKLAKY
jgi:hypothetical protein